jgi:tetratricopeptide (TPR) repeat protein
MVADVLVERHLLRAVTPPPPSLTIARLIDDDPVNPRAESRLAAERVDGPEDPEEHFLGEVQRFVVIAEQVQRQLVHHALVLVDQLGAGVLIACGAALNQGSFPPPDFVPGDGSNRLHRQSLCHLSTPSPQSWALRNHGSFGRLEPAFRQRFPTGCKCYYPRVKRAIAVVLVLSASLAIAYGYVVTRREADHRELIQRGDAAMAAGDLSTAIEAFSGAIFLRDDSMIGYLKRGDAYRRRDELEAALRDLRRAIEIDPSATRPRELLGDVNFARNRFSSAVEHYAAYVKLDDGSPRVLYKLALAHYRAGQPLSGIQALKRAVGLDDRFAEAYYLLGLCQRDAQRWPDALVSLRRAITLAPALLPAREELADLYNRLSRSQDWLEQLEALRALDPSPARDVALGLAYAKAGQSERAVLTLRHAAERHPTHRQTYIALGRVWLDTAQARSDRVELGKALEALEQAVAVEGTSEAYMLLGRALLLASAPERAENMLQLATQKLPVDPLAFFYLAEASERQSHFEAARGALIDYTALTGDEQDGRRRAMLALRLGDLSTRLADYIVALPYYERAAPILGSDPDFIVKLAEARWRAGQNDAALALVDKLLEKDPAHASARALKRRLKP